MKTHLLLIFFLITSCTKKDEVKNVTPEVKQVEKLNLMLNLN
jgi:hypothetical protein